MTLQNAHPTRRPASAAWISDQIHALDHVFTNINLGGGTVVASVNMSLGGGLFSGTCDRRHRRNPRSTTCAARGC